MLENSMVNYTNSQSLFYKKLKESDKFLVHMHAVHAHPCCHTFDGKTDNVDYGDPYFKRCDTNCYETKFYPDSTPTPAGVLMREVSLKVDCDNNGKIFTEDFLLDKEDPSVPVMLISMQRLKIRHLGIPIYTWEEYLSTVSPNAFV